MWTIRNGSEKSFNALSSWNLSFWPDSVAPSNYNPLQEIYILIWTVWTPFILWSVLRMVKQFLERYSYITVGQNRGYFILILLFIFFLFLFFISLFIYRWAFYVISCERHKSFIDDLRRLVTRAKLTIWAFNSWRTRDSKENT